MDERFVVRLDVQVIKSAKERAKKLYETLEQIDKELETHEFKEIPTKLKAMLKKDVCLLYTSPSPRDLSTSRMPSSA